MEPKPAGTRTLDGLVAALERLAEQSETLAGDVRADAAQRHRENRATLVMGALLLAIGIGVLVIGWENHQINRRIQDCTTEGGTCQQESARRTGKAVEELVRASLAIEECADELGEGSVTHEALSRCVARKLAPSPSPSP